ncbi:MAG: hypothetical protein R3F56_02195 [Planctomycetota bacterium]
MNRKVLWRRAPVGESEREPGKATRKRRGGAVADRAAPRSRDCWWLKVAGAPAVRADEQAEPVAAAKSFSFARGGQGRYG